MKFSLRISGSVQDRARSAAMLCSAAAEVLLRRFRKGPRCDAWNFSMELGTEILRRQLLVAFQMSNVDHARSYLDSLALRSAALASVRVSAVTRKDLVGKWVVPETVMSDATILYLHGGGYAYDPSSFYDNLEALISVSTGARMFALDYRLSPEHRFPAQLEDALRCYRWLLRKVKCSHELVIVGDSAGGNLGLALLLRLRDLNLPLPSLAVCLSPATDFRDNNGLSSQTTSPDCDWITQEMAIRWADWYCDPKERDNPLISPVTANLRNLPPIYIQAGELEILFDRIKEFTLQAASQGADVLLETWPGMNHDFQVFGYDVPESAEAIRRIGEIVASHVPLKSTQHVAS